MRRNLISYTQDVCDRHDVPMQEFGFIRGYYDIAEERWKPIRTKLPLNPYNGRPILLVPHEYLRALPTINADDFWDYCYTNENETLRTEFSYDITRRVNKQEIVGLARRRTDLLMNYIQYAESRLPEPYDIARDPKGHIQWYDSSAAFCKYKPLEIEIRRNQEFFEAIDTMTKQFVHFVEEHQGWRLLWDDRVTKGKSEEAAQRLFLGIILHYCRANDIDISKEANLGRGSVDFKVARGYSLRALIEVKLARNTKFWDGLRKQLPTYQKAEGVEVGYFLVIVYTEEDLQRIAPIRKVVQEVNESTGYEITPVIVDARPGRPSASRL